MNILFCVVHYWKPTDDSSHQSLRADPLPRIYALTSLISSLRRLGLNQSVLHMKDRAIYRINDFFRFNIDLRIITDGTNTILNQLPLEFQSSYREVITTVDDPKFLGFKSHEFLLSLIDEDFDLFCYLEDDLIIHDPLFFHKIMDFNRLMGDECLLLPHRFEFSNYPHPVDRLFIDGPIDDDELKRLVPSDGPVRLVHFGGYSIPFAPPQNPHSGCFFLTRSQLEHWSRQSFWMDMDASFVSPLESAATLGISKAFSLFKPCLSHASWFEIQHYGTSFHSLISK